MSLKTPRSPLVALGLAAAIFVTLAAGPAEAQTKLLRFPDVHGSEVVFCYGGDLWTAPADGGVARRITAHPGQELFPKFSPDGRYVAFTGQYDGDEQVYVMPAEGGEPVRLTYYPARGPLAPRHGFDYQVYGWTPDGSSVLFRSFRDAGGAAETNLYTVSVDGGLPERLPMPTAGAGDFSPDGGKMVYSPLFRDFRSWKRYQGGWAQDLYLFDLASHDAEKIADTPRSERDPMWIGDKIYFSSDRDGTLNLYRYDPASGDVAQLTHSEVWDVRWPSTDHGSRIVYELDGELRIFDVDAGTDAGISIEVPDDGLARRPSRVSAAEQVESIALSPGGERALFVARGDVFTAPIEHGPTRNLTATSGAHDKWASWSPDGRWIAFVSDLSGEDELYLVDQEGTGEPERLTTGSEAMRYAPEWSPDGERLAFSDSDGKLWVLTLEGRELTEVAEDGYQLIQHYRWSPRGGHLAFALEDANQLQSIHLWSVEDGKVRRVTSELGHESEPVWGTEGDYLYFIARREFDPQISSLEWNYAGNRDLVLLALALRKDVADPFPPRSDEVTIDGGDDKKENGKTENGEKKEEGYLRIDFDGLAERVTQLPIEAGNYTAPAAAPGHLLYARYDAFFYDRGEPVGDLLLFSFEKRESTPLAEGINNYAVSADGKKVLVQKGSDFRLLDVAADPGEGKTVSTAGLVVDRVPAEEWAAIFDEVWRRYRDFFYVENMHGYDWRALGDRYRALLPHVAHRSDLNYVISEMISELNVGHAYIQGGDYEMPERAPVGLPGARFELDPEAGRYRIAEIFAGANDEAKYRAPLTEIGVDAREGDYLLAIDGVELAGDDNPYRLLQHKTDPVTLTLNATPSTEGARQVTYEPVASESPLIYLDWVEGNRRKVAEMTGGRVGYFHLPNMGAAGIAEFVKWYYPQIRKEGLVVDVRSNGGGNVSQWILERLDTELLGTRFGRVRGDNPLTYPYSVFHGHMVCLINETSASDGDIFPYRFRKAGLGPLIGKRTWGGVVGISGRGPLIDGGVVYVPEMATNDVDGSYVVEGYGVDPDVEVENDPQAVLAGRDPQLERGVEEVMKRIEADPKTLPNRPPDPVKTE